MLLKFLAWLVSRLVGGLVCVGPGFVTPPPLRRRG